MSHGHRMLRTPLATSWNVLECKHAACISSATPRPRACCKITLSCAFFDCMHTRLATGKRSWGTAVELVASSSVTAAWCPMQQFLTLLFLATCMVQGSGNDGHRKQSTVCTHDE